MYEKLKLINLLLGLLLLIPSKFYGQEKTQRINFTFLVDEKIVGFPGQPKLYSDKKNKKREYFDISIIPGELSVSESDLYKIFSDPEDSIFISFNYYSYSPKQNINNYIVRIHKEWFKYSWAIFRIYDLDNKKYHKIIPEHPGDKYAYEIDLPGYSILRVRRK